MKTAMQEWIEWLKAYEYELPLELQIKAKELLEKEKEQIMKAFLEGKVNHSKDWAIEYYNQTYNEKETLEEWKSKFTLHCAIKPKNK